jgi:phenylalanyl-tRNA synthetase beta chain
LAGGEISMDIKDVYPTPVEEKVVELNFDYLNTMIGKEIDRFQVRNILEGLEIKIVAEKEKSILVSIPTYRVDVTRPADVVEEVLRIYGYNNVEIPSKVKSVLTYRLRPDKEAITNSVANFLTSKGYREIMNNSLTASSYYESLTSYPSEKLVMIKNPLSSELNAMRQTLLFGMLESIVHNVNRQKRDIRFYEFGNVVSLSDPKNKSNLKNYSENYSFAIAITGIHSENMWNNPPVQNDFFEIKTQVEQILKRLNIKITEKKFISNDIFDFGLEYKNNDLTLFTFGKVSSKINKNFDIETPVFYAETNFETLINLYGKNIIEFEDLPKFPEVQRDIAVLIDKDVTFNDIEKIIASVKSRLIKEVYLFDVYENEDKLGKGKKSYAIRFILQDKNKTLKDEEANKLIFKIINKLEKELNASVRS